MTDDQIKDFETPRGQELNLDGSLKKTVTIDLRQAKLGEMVVFFPNPDDSVARSNHATEIPAIVTRVWGPGMVNLKIIPDHGPMQDRGSVAHKSLNSSGSYCFMYQDEYQP